MKIFKPFMGVTKGAVYFYDHNAKEVKDTKVLTGRLAYIVISENEDNMLNETCIVLPLVNTLPEHYNCRNYYQLSGFEEFYSVKINNPVTVDIQSLTEAVAFLPDYIVNNIQDAMKSLFGQILAKPMHDTINDKIYTTDRPVLNYTNTEELTDDQANILKYYVAEEKDIALDKDENYVKRGKDLKKRYRRPTKWTYKLSVQYIEDCIALSKVEVCTKYNLSPDSYYDRKSRARKLVQKHQKMSKTNISKGEAL